MCVCVCFARQKIFTPALYVDMYHSLLWNGTQINLNPIFLTWIGFYLVFFYLFIETENTYTIMILH